MEQASPERIPSPPAIVPTSSTNLCIMGIGSIAKRISQQHLVNSRKALLKSTQLPENHDFRKRVNEYDGSLLNSQPNGMARKIYEPGKIPKPRIRKDKDGPSFCLARRQLMSMWNGIWTNDSDWAAWDRLKEKMEEQFDSYRLVERSNLGARREQTYKGSERKRKRHNQDSVSPSWKKRQRREESDSGGGSSGGEQKSVEEFILPTKEEVLAVIPLEGIKMAELLRKFWRPDRWDRKRFCAMLHEIGSVDKFTKVFTVDKTMGAREAQEESRIVSFEDGDMLMDSENLNTSSINSCIQASKVGVC